MTASELSAMFELQGFACATCRCSEADVVVDHDHTTGLVMGLLCAPCNKMLGHAKDNVLTLLCAAQFLKGNANMAGFKDALAQYKKQSDVKVNPPEAQERVLPEATVPETEGKPEPAPLEVGKKTRAPRGSSKKSAEPAASADSVPTTDVPASAVEDAVHTIANLKSALHSGETVSTTDLHGLMNALYALGYTVTLTRTPKS